MKKTKLLGKALSVVLTLAIFFSMAIPAFAASGSHDKASFEIVSCEPYANLNNYVKISYKVVMSCADISCLKAATVKVDGKSISYSSFKKDSTGKYVYEGTIYKANTPSNTLTFEASDLHVQMSSGKQTETYKVSDIVNTYPSVYIASIGTGLGLLGNTVVSISAKDNTGLKSIAVNGKVIANASKINGAKTFSTVYDVYYDGIYNVVVTDVDGFKTTVYFQIQDGEIVSQSSGSYPIGGDLSTYIPFYYYFGYSSLSEMMQENPYLYYYYIYSNYGGDISSLYPYYPSLPNLPSVNYPSISLPSFGTDSNSNYLWYIYMNNILGNSDIDSEQLLNYYYYLMLFQNAETDSDSLLNYYYYMMLMQGSNGLDEDQLMSYYYYLMLSQGSSDGSVNSDILSNMLIYKYIYGNAVSFTDGNAIIVSAVGNTHKLTAPAIANSKNAKYQWQKLVGGKWIDIAGATSSEYVLPSIVKGERYRVTISSTFYYSVLTSSVYIAGTTGVTETEPAEPVVPPTTTPDTSDTTFTADDISIRGMSFPIFTLKVGQSVDLIPSCIGYWNVNSSLVSTNSTIGSIRVTGEKAGVGVLTFTGFDGKGNTAVKYVYFQITE